MDPIKVPVIDRLKASRVPALVMLGLTFAFTVAGVTGKISWGHIVHVGREVGEPDSALLPVAVDGMMMTGAVMGAIDALRGYRPRAWSIIALWVGSVLTMAFNIGSAWQRGFWAMVIAAIPAVALLVTVEAIFHPSKRLARAAVTAIKTAVAAVETAVATAAPVPTLEPTDAPTEPTPAPEAPVAPAAPGQRPPRPRRASPTAARGAGSRGGKSRARVSVEPPVDVDATTTETVSAPVG